MDEIEDKKELKFEDLKFDSFTDYELKSLRLFQRQVEKMNECKVIRDGSLQFNFSAKRTVDGLETIMEATDDDELALLLLRIRPCLLEKDRIFFNKIVNILGRKAANEETRKYFRTLHKNYQFFLNSAAVEFHVDGKKYGQLEIFNACINGDYFHIRDEEPRKIVEQFEKVPYMTRTALIICTIDYLKWFMLIDLIIKLCVLTNYPLP